MIPGEILVADGEIVLNAGRRTVTVTVANTGDRPVQVGSHYHFHEANPALSFDRDAARGFRLDISAGTAVRFEPGQSRTVTLVALDGLRRVFGLRGAVSGPLDGGRPGRGASGKAASGKASGKAQARQPAVAKKPSVARAKPAAPAKQSAAAARKPPAAAKKPPAVARKAATSAKKPAASAKR